MAAPLRILCTGDLHIGRRPSRLATEDEARACSCAAVVADIVERAIRERIDVVLISGDLVDRDNRFFEAIGPLERGLSKLGKAGIDTIAISGNHDFDVLPQLADHLPDGRFRLLGRGGRWERYTLARDGRPVMHVDGWSFATEHVEINPMRDYPSRAASDGLPVIGMLHCDLDNPKSAYAPVGRSDFRGTGADLWLLGHIHQFKLHADGNGPGVLYPGSPQAMDPGEPGAHGPWLVELSDRGTRIEPVHLPMSRVRYDVVVVDVTDVATDVGLNQRVIDAVRGHAKKVAACCGPLQFASLRLRLVGRTELHRRLLRQGYAMGEDLDLTVGDFAVRIEQTEIATRPLYSLEEMARGDDAAAVLSRLILSLDRDEQPHEQDAAGTFGPLMDQVENALSMVHSAVAYQSIADDAAAALPGARAVLVKQGYALLDTLLEHREEAAA